jgi:hypothetical protein
MMTTHNPSVFSILYSVQITLNNCYWDTSDECRRIIPSQICAPAPPSKANGIVAVRLSCQLDNGNPGAAPALGVPHERLIALFCEEDTGVRLPDSRALVLPPPRHISPRRDAGY